VCPEYDLVVRTADTLFSTMVEQERKTTRRLVVTDRSALRQFKLMESAFNHAMEGNPDISNVSTYIFGGYNARLRILGHELARGITKAFAHLQANGLSNEPPFLTIDVWDQEETGVCCRVDALNENMGCEKVIAMSSDGRFVGEQLANTLTCYNNKTQHIISSIVRGGETSVYVSCKPLARALLEWHNDRGVQMVHAGLVAQHGNGVLFVGKSGCGKSTSALACLSAGFDFLSEDYVGLQRLDDGSFIGHSLYNSVFLSPDHLARFPALIPYVMEGMPHEEKSAVVLSQVFPERLKRVVPIRALVLPRIVDTTRSMVRPASKGEALLSLGPSSLLQIPNRRLGIRGFGKLARLVEQVPSYWLDLGRDLDSIPLRMEELLRELASS